MSLKTGFLVAILLFIIFSSIAIGQEPDTVWTKIYGEDHHELGECIIPTSDGCFLIAGSNHSTTFGGYDYYLMKIDQNGDSLWTRHFGTIDTERGAWAVEKSDGGFMMIGSFDIYAPNTPRDIFIVNTDSLGYLTSTRMYGGSDDDFANKIVETSDGNFMILGNTDSFGIGNLDIWLIKVNQLGDTLWTSTIGTSGDEYAYGLESTADGGYIIGGVQNTSGTQAEDACLIKTDSLGNPEWIKSYGYEHNDRVHDIAPLPDGGYIAVGYMTHSIPTMRDFYVLKTDAYGDTLWTRNYGNAREDWAYSVNINNSGHYIVAGMSENGFYPDTAKILVLCLDSNGDTVWTKNICNGLRTLPKSIIQTSDNGYILTGWTTVFYDNDWQNDLYIARLSPEFVGVYDQDFTIPYQLNISQNYPNPFNASTTISYSLSEQSEVSIEIYDILGRKIDKLSPGRQSAGEHNVIWNAENLTSGVYFFRIQAGNYTEARKMVLLK